VGAAVAASRHYPEGGDGSAASILGRACVHHEKLRAICDIEPGDTPGVRALKDLLWPGGSSVEVIYLRLRRDEAKSGGPSWD